VGLIVHEAAVVAGVTMLAVAACADVARRIIPNALAVGVAVAGMIARCDAGASAVLTSLAAAAALFLALAFLHRRRMLGGGDVKLASAVALSLPLAALGGFLEVTALAGGALAALHLMLRPVARRARAAPRGALLRRVWAAECWRIRRRGSLPYGVAIALGGAWMMLSGS
jgi:prepilin peptidase CpaA